MNDLESELWDLLAKWEAQEQENHRLANTGNFGSITFPDHTNELRTTLERHCK